MLRAINGLGAVSLTDWWPVRGIVLAGTVLVVLLTVRYARRITSILLATVLLAGLVMANLLLGGNAYYGTYPTAGSFLAGTPAVAPAPPAGIPPTGQTVPVPIPGTRSGFAARPALVHLPRAWFADPRPTLPVVMLLHGSPGAPQEWLDPGAADRITDAWADRNGGVAPILVMPDVTGEAGGVCADTATGNVETYLAVDVPAFVQAEFSARAPGTGWAVVGHSSGGTCALTLALRHANLFRTFAVLGGSAGLAPDPAHDPTELLGARGYRGVAGWFQVGGSDPALATVEQLVPLAAAAGIDTCLVVRPGAVAGEATWSPAFADVLPWLSARVGQVAQTPDMTSACGVFTP